MRDYGSVSPQFWIGQTGKALRGNMPAQILALYLMTSPHANMIGVFYCPVDYMAKETGMTLEGASKALQSLVDVDFCRFDHATEEVFVVRMAAFQIGDQLDPKDNRCKGVAKELEKVTSSQLRQGFRANYAVPFNLPMPGSQTPQTASPSEAPSEPLRSQNQEQDQKQEQKKTPRKARATSLPENFEVSDRVKAWAGEKGFSNIEPHFDAFVSYAKRKGATYVDWDEALMNAVRNDWGKTGGKAASAAGERFV